jgi:hypothetical protein
MVSSVKRLTNSALPVNGKFCSSMLETRPPSSQLASIAAPRQHRQQVLDLRNIKTGNYRSDTCGAVKPDCTRENAALGTSN